MKLNMSASRRWILLAVALAAMAFTALAYFSQYAADDATEVERRLARTLSAINGAGQVRVMILGSADAAQVQSVYAQFSPVSEGSVQGIIVVAEGANDLAVRLELSRAVQTIFDIDARAIEVFPMQGG